MIQKVYKSLLNQLYTVEWKIIRTNTIWNDYWLTLCTVLSEGKYKVIEGFIFMFLETFKVDSFYDIVGISSEKSMHFCQSLFIDTPTLWLWLLLKSVIKKPSRILSFSCYSYITRFFFDDEWEILTGDFTFLYWNQ